MSGEDAPGSRGGGGGTAGSGHWGHWRSWLCVVVMIGAFTVAGVGLTLGPSWPLVVGGGVVFAVAGIAALALGIMRDTVVDLPHEVPEAEPATPDPPGDDDGQDGPEEQR